MKSIIVFWAGVLVGVSGLFIFLSMPSREAASPLTAVVTAAPAVTSAPVVESPAPAPPVPVVEAPPAIALASEPAPAPIAMPVVSADAPAPASTLPASSGNEAKPFDKLLIPVAGIKASQLTDTFTQMRGTDRRHDAIDIMAPNGTRVLAVADGKVVKLFESKLGGLTVYQFDTGEKFSYYYAHLDRYAPGLSDGMVLKRGDLVGYVGSTGNANPAAPHLHFAIFELTPEKQWWNGRPINPYPLLRE